MLLGMGLVGTGRYQQGGCTQTAQQTSRVPGLSLVDESKHFKDRSEYSGVRNEVNAAEKLLSRSRGEPGILLIRARIHLPQP